MSSLGMHDNTNNAEHRAYPPLCKGRSVPQMRQMFKRRFSATITMSLIWNYITILTINQLNCYFRFIQIHCICFITYTMLIN